MCTWVSSFDLTILHTNDIHTRFEETSENFGGVCTAELAEQGVCYGGEARRATVVKEIRQSVPNTLLLDAGDHFQGTVWFYAFRGEASACFMNLLGYDAMALGNHEFDIGISGLLPFLNNVSFPVLSCNIDSTSEPSMSGLYACYTVVNMEGAERVGIVGYTSVDTPLFSKSGNLVFNPEVESLQPAVDKLIASGVNKIIALGHSGIDTDMDIAQHVQGIDIVVGGHTNTFMYTGSPPSSEVPYSDYPLVVRPSHDPSSTVLIISAYAYGKYLGRLDVTFDEEGAVRSFDGNPILLDSNVQQDADTLNDMLLWKQQVDLVANEVVGTSLVPLQGNEFCYFIECNMGNILADAMLESFINQTDGSWSDVAVAMTTTGSVSANEVTAGDITINDLLLNMPYGNTIDVLELKGKHILDMLEHSVKRYEDSGNAGEFIQLSGLQVIYDVTLPIGQRVVDVRVRCADCTVPSYSSLNMEKVYRVAMNSYMAGGGYGFSANQNKLSLIKGELDVEVTSRYFQTYSPITTGLERRVTVYNGNSPCYRDPSAGKANQLMDVNHLTFVVVLSLLSVVLNAKMN
ncbi:snake venom 5'-nucleotidase-like [Asterias rubens]|uniref:snake venom 5'-nucleotidase-like n=1 Tax=Asterias rubens TaxID=7604 RepID=UPI001455B770|nr:snake venom 5'-nucleotidase-like [Asterias rubens]